jgi:hypothetical protein
MRTNVVAALAAGGRLSLFTANRGPVNYYGRLMTLETAARRKHGTGIDR